MLRGGPELHSYCEFATGQPDKKMGSSFLDGPMFFGRFDFEFADLFEAPEVHDYAGFDLDVVDDPAHRVIRSALAGGRLRNAEGGDAADVVGHVKAQAEPVTRACFKAAADGPAHFIGRGELRG